MCALLLSPSILYHLYTYSCARDSSKYPVKAALAGRESVLPKADCGVLRIARPCAPPPRKLFGLMLVVDEQREKV